MLTTEDQYLRLMGSALMSLGTDAIFIVDAETLRLSQANRAFTRAFGYAPEDVMGLHLLDLVASDRETIDRSLTKIVTEGEAMLGVRPYRRQDGTIVEMESRVGTTIVDGRKFYCVVSRDLTEIRQTERSLRDSEERFRKLADVSFEGIAITEAGRVVDANRRCCELLRTSATDLIGKSVTDFVAPASREKVAAHFQSGSEAPYEHFALCADGTILPVEVQAKSVTIGGRPLRVTAIRDISERRSLEAQVRLAQRMESVGRLAGGVAHDFNNLLTVILSLVDIMTDAPNNQASAEDLAQIRAAADRASSLTRQLLTFARRQIVEPRIVDLNVLVKSLDTMLRRVIGEDIELTSVCASDLGRVRADPSQMEQVLMNLAVNARDAMEKGGHLTIETTNVTLGDDYLARHPDATPGAYVMVSVSDTGGGMDQATMTHIFEPFFTTKAAGKGTGLGLATCYGIVKQSGGLIWVYSEIGKGTTFKVYIPRVWDAATAIERRAGDVALGGTETLLVVEDNDMVRRLAVRILESQGYRVLEASDGVDGLRLHQTHQGRVDLVITDVVLPKMSGKEMSDKLRETWPDIKILYTSGYTENTIIHQGVADQDINFLGKPYVSSELLARVREILDEK